MNLPDCLDHPKTKVRRYGTYGTRKRQRFWCAGAGGHTFTETLPRQMTAAGDCLECERRLARHEGPPTPRRGTYTVREIAAALMRVGEGMSYRAAGRFVRRRAGRKANGEGRLVADWVETYAPLIYQPQIPSAWPDVLLIDEIPFHIRWQNRPSGRQPYSILGAMEWRPDGQHRLIRLEARGGAGKQDWIEFLSALPGTPRRIVCDAAKPPQAAIAAVWGTQPPIVFLCHWHLARRFRELLKRDGRTGDPIEKLLEAAFSSPTEWSAFTSAARVLPAPTIQFWLRAHEQRVTWQVANMKGGGCQHRAAGECFAGYPRHPHLPPFQSSQPRAPEPLADALDAQRQRPGRRAGLRRSDPLNPAEARRGSSTSTGGP